MGLDELLNDIRCHVNTMLANQSKGEWIDYARRLEGRIKELEDGACRFNCRTAKMAEKNGFIAGFLYDYNVDSLPSHTHAVVISDAEEAYEKWLDTMSSKKTDTQAEKSSGRDR